MGSIPSPRPMSRLPRLAQLTEPHLAHYHSLTCGLSRIGRATHCHSLCMGPIAQSFSTAGVGWPSLPSVVSLKSMTCGPFTTARSSTSAQEVDRGQQPPSQPRAPLISRRCWSSRSTCHKYPLSSFYSLTEHHGTR